MSIFEFIPLLDTPPQARVIVQEHIRGDIPWAYFDGASDPQNRCGAGLVIHDPSGKILKASIGLGQGTNNFVELKSLHHLLCWLSFLGIRDFQIFGDSMNIIKWFNGTQRYQHFYLSTLLEEVFTVKVSFNQVTSCHIYKERNHATDILSKEGTRQDLGQWVVVEAEGGKIRGINPPPFGR